MYLYLKRKYLEFVTCNPIGGIFLSTQQIETGHIQDHVRLP